MVQKLFSKNFTLLVFGQVSSLFGNYIIKFALSMYVLDITGSATVFAGILSIAIIPTIILSPLGGILADRVNRKHIMVTLDTLSGIFILGAALLFTKQDGIVLTVILLVCLSVLGAFESPTVQACVPQMQSGDNIIKGNAVVNQVAAVAALIAPILGSILYTTFGVKPILFAGVLCFFVTATLESFIKLDHIPSDNSKGILSIIKNDFLISMHFIGQQQPSILKMLLLSALISFFVMGTAMVGLPYIVRNVLCLGAEYYGFAESALGFVAIIGSVAAGLLTEKIKFGKLAIVVMILGFFLIPAGVAFLLPITVITKYMISIIAFCGMQIAACIFSIFLLSIIQQKTPSYLTGKVMSYVATISMCAQPIGQMVYGLLFDKFSNAIFLVLIPTGIFVFIIGQLSTSFFEKLEV